MLTIELIFLILLILTLIVIFIPRMLHSIFSNDAPFIPTKGKALSTITELLDLHDGAILYDLGCGDGRILHAAISDAMRRGIKASGVGIDNDWLPTLFARIKTGNLPIKIQRSTIAECDLSEATHIYVYLLPSMLLEIERQIAMQCKPGTKIVACDFPLPSLQKQKEVALTGKQLLSKTLYVYSL